MLTFCGFGSPGGCLSELSTFIPKFVGPTEQNPGKRLRLPVTSGQRHMKDKPCACRIDRRVRMSVEVLEVLVQEGWPIEVNN